MTTMFIRGFFANNIFPAVSLYTIAIKVLIVLTISGCSPRNKVSFDEDALLSSIDTIDAFIATLPAKVENEGVMRLRATEIGDVEKYINGEFDAETQYRNSDLAWNGFKQLCRDKKYKEAHDIYFTDENKGDIMVYLRHSAARFGFYSKVLWPLLKEYNDYDTALQKYIGSLNLEFLLEQFAVTNGDGQNKYVPVAYPDVILELGRALAQAGKTEEALEMGDDLANAVYSLTDDAIYANFMLTSYAINIYNIVGDVELAKDVIEQYRELLTEELKKGADKSELDYYLKKAEELLN